MTRTPGRAAIAGAVLAPLTLGLLVALPFIAPLVLPRSDSVHPTTEMLVNEWNWLTLAGGVAWGVALARITGHNVIRLGAAGLIGIAIGHALVFGPLSAALAPLFPITLENQQHVEITVTLPLATATVFAAMGLAFAIGAGAWRRAPIPSLGAAAAATAAVMLTITALDAIGVRTGTGDLAMPKVMVFGAVAACAAAGAVQAGSLRSAD